MRDNEELIKDMQVKLDERDQKVRANDIALEELMKGKAALEQEMYTKTTAQ